MYLPLEMTIDFVEGARLLGAGLATIGLTGAGIGIVQYSVDSFWP